MQADRLASGTQLQRIRGVPAALPARIAPPEPPPGVVPVWPESSG